MGVQISNLSIREAKPSDWRNLADLFTRSVHKIAASSYSDVQIASWAPSPPEYQVWETRFTKLKTFVAEIEGRPAAFISLLPPRHIELLFTDPSNARLGVATILYQHLLQHIEANGDPLTTDASIEARPFFEKNGWTVVEPELVERSGVQFQRFRMKLTP